jgi:hypothetical protein
MSTRVLTTIVMLSIAWAVPRPVAAQHSTPITVSFGLATLREQGPGNFPASTYDKGWVLSGAFPVGLDRLLVAAELGRHERLNVIGENQEVTASLIGARYLLSRSSRLTTFAQALFGTRRFIEPGFEASGFSFQAGGGVDFLLWKGAGVRAQADYRRSTEGNATFKDWRLFFGGVYSFGF